MWAWYFVLLILIFMAIVQFISTRRKKPFPGLKKLIPGFNQEIGAEIAPHNKTGTQRFIEKITRKNIPYFETTLDLYEKRPEKLVAEWSLGENFKNQITQKYGQEFWHNTKSVLRINHTNAVPNPYHQDFDIHLEKGIAEIQLHAPGETLNSQIGVITETGSFISFAQSNDVVIPKKQ
ncbi:MAG: hypothetical protein PWP71_1320 [Clostridia bacterium]|jgi:hypothetical protein|nr:hypothetical protein [Clostridia bacterium]